MSFFGVPKELNSPMARLRQAMAAGDAIQVAVIDIGKPETNFGWALGGLTHKEPCAKSGQNDIDVCVDVLAEILKSGPLALGFEAPLFVPYRMQPTRLTSARAGECENGVSRPYSAGAGAAVLVTALTVIPYILARLKAAVPQGTATLDWRANISMPGEILLFEAFVTNQKNQNESRHSDDAYRAVTAFQRGILNPLEFPNAIREPQCLNLLGAMLIKTGWRHDAGAISESCLVVRA